MYARVKLAVNKETKECVAVKIIHLAENNGDSNIVTPDCLKKEVRCIKYECLESR